MYTGYFICQLHSAKRTYNIGHTFHFRRDYHYLPLTEVPLYVDKQSLEHINSRKYQSPFIR